MAQASHNPIGAFKTFILCVPLLLITPATKAQQSSTLELPGLLEPVEILRDSWGVNHIYANNQHDLFLVQQGTFIMENICLKNGYSGK